jgi:hypothetical protein
MFSIDTANAWVILVSLCVATFLVCVLVPATWGSAWHGYGNTTLQKRQTLMLSPEEKAGLLILT